MKTITAHGRSAFVDSENGGIINALVDADGSDLMAIGNPPHPELRSRGNLASTGFRGWIDCFPTINPEPDETNGRPSLNLTAHGELWNRSWRLMSHSSNEVSMMCELRDLGVSYCRTIRLTRDSLFSTSKIVNTGPNLLLYVWASHPLLAADSTTWIELNESPFTSWPESDQGDENLDSVWPATVSRRRWVDLPIGFARKLFLPWPEDGVRFSSHGRERHIGFTIVGDSGQVRPHLGLWLNRGGFPVDAPLHHFAIEPTIGDSDSLEASTRRNTAGRLEPESSVEFVVQLDF
jgi:hypothetical protein